MILVAYCTTSPNAPFIQTVKELRMYVHKDYIHNRIYCSRQYVVHSIHCTSNPFASCKIYNIDKTGYISNERANR